MTLKHLTFCCILAGAAMISPPLRAQDVPPPPVADKGLMMLTIFFKHDEQHPLSELNERLKQQHFYESFPPKGVEIVSWYVMMGVGQVVTLRFPAERLREVNRAVEGTAWGPYRTEFYPTYDYKPTALDQRGDLH